MKYFSADYKRYKQAVGRVFYEPSIIIVFIYRLRKGIYRCPFIVKIIPALFIEPLYFFLTLLFGIQLPKSCEIGPGLLIHHFGGIILNPTVKIGNNCTLRQNVTIGSRYASTDAPQIGNNVNIGCGAIILGNIKIGNNVNIGAGSIVLTDIPDNCTAVGNPAKIIKKNS